MPSGIKGATKQKLTLSVDSTLMNDIITLKRKEVNLNLSAIAENAIRQRVEYEKWRLELK